ncbi:UPF0481 protein [Senna tora]|uniref:UPF0481 protein n=1 Tax=Senna tora TaxID=362788 RepID=A0A834WSV6_9FABA|nr:UPF0481 protein [Senna tora]
METHKHVFFFKAFVDRSRTGLDNLIAVVRNSEPIVREYYSENIELSEREFVRMVLVDVGFIIELFLKIHEDNWYSLDDPTLSRPWFTNKIILDLIMLENQLPFFILEEIFNLAFPPSSTDHPPSFLELTFAFFDYYNVQKLDPSATPDFGTKHFTDLLQTFHLKPGKSERYFFERMGSNALLYGANELHEAGVKFKVNTTKKCLLDLNFSGGVFEIPQIMVQEETEHEFRNMIALEQCHYPFESYICDYALFLDCLINTSMDVDILVHRQIIRKFLADSDDVARVFNGLCKDILHVNFNADYYNMCTKLNAFCKNPWNNMKATLRRDYCKTPWQIVASIAGIVGKRAGVGCVIRSDRGRVLAASFRSDFSGDLGSICNPLRPRSSCPKVVVESDAAEVINRIHKLLVFCDENHTITIKNVGDKKIQI